MKKTAATTSKKGRGLIRSLNRSLVRDDKSPAVVRKTRPFREPTICPGCGSAFLHKTWRRDHKLSHEMLARSQWRLCPACGQVGRQEGQGRVLIRGTAVAESRETIQRRIDNVTQRAMNTQPQRRLVSVAPLDGEALEVLTTSQKLAHRIVHELKKAFGGHASYSWNDDGMLFATWDYDRPKSRAKRA
ncbi:MAG: hypothetical protein WA005_14770 [Candidatus Binataceae bacterium]